MTPMRLVDPLYTFGPMYKCLQVYHMELGTIDVKVHSPNKVYFDSRVCLVRYHFNRDIDLSIAAR